MLSIDVHAGEASDDGTHRNLKKINRYPKGTPVSTYSEFVSV